MTGRFSAKVRKGGWALRQDVQMGVGCESSGYYTHDNRSLPQISHCAERLAVFQLS